MGYGHTIRVAKPFDETVDAVRVALTAEGFGVLTEIDVRRTLAEKLGTDLPEYLILGACNPPLAHRAIEIEPGIGLLLPCNVVVRVDGDETVVQALDPNTMVTLTGNTELAGVAGEAGARLESALAEVAASLGS